MNEIEIKEGLSKKILRNKINIKFVLIFLLLPSLIFSCDRYIQLTLKDIGIQQIISDKFNISEYYPIKITVNGDEVQMSENKKIDVHDKNNVIEIYWGNVTDNLTYMFADLSNIVSIKLNGMLSKNCNLSYFAYNCINLESFEYTNLDINFSINDMRYMFYNCKSLQTFSFNNPKFENNYAINIGYMFYNGKNITHLTYGSKDIKISDMSYTFYNCLKLNSIDLSQFKSENDINISYAFYNCQNLISFIQGKNIGINNMRYLFYNNIQLNTIYINYNTHNYPVFVNMSYSFFNCVKLKHFNYSDFDGNIRPNDMRSMFYNCTDIESVQIRIDINCSNISMNKMFYNCQNLISVQFKNNNNKNDNYYYPNDMHRMLYNCFNLSSLNFQCLKKNKFCFRYELFVL